MNYIFTCRQATEEELDLLKSNEMSLESISNFANDPEEPLRLLASGGFSQIISPYNTQEYCDTIQYLTGRYIQSCYN